MDGATHKVGKLDVFVSYSRDDLEFAEQLNIALNDANFNATLDRVGIPGADEWKRRLTELIRDADAVVFVLSPSSARSEECQWEVDEAARFGKRIIPVLCKPLDGSAPPARLANLNYIYFYTELKVPTSGFGSGLAKLKGVLNEEKDWLREHTRLLKLALRWLQAGGARHALLVGADVAKAEAWLRKRLNSAPELSEPHKNFIAESTRAESLATALRKLNRTRWAAALLLLLFALSAVEGALYFWAYQDSMVAVLGKQKADDKIQLDQLRQKAQRELRGIAAENLKRIVKMRAGSVSGQQPRADSAPTRKTLSPDERISQTTLDFILLYEVGGEEGYRRRYSRVQRPLNNSGVTIGIGYDLKFVSEQKLRAEWRELPSSYLDKLAPLALKSRKEAEALYNSVQNIEIPFIIARKVYIEHTLVETIKNMERKFPEAVNLPPDSYGALVSVVLNRGSRLIEQSGDPSGDRDEMRAIAKLLELGEYAAIPDQIRSMKWLWWMSERNDVKGLSARREAEAELFERGLRAKISAAPAPDETGEADPIDSVAPREPRFVHPDAQTAQPPDTE